MYCRFPRTRMIVSQLSKGVLDQGRLQVPEEREEIFGPVRGMRAFYQ